MRFIHISDNHIGRRPDNLDEREQDFYDVFQQAIDRIIEERPDFVVHSGDLFDDHRPQIKALLEAKKAFQKLKESNIPVYAIPGNHDTVMRRKTKYPQELFQDYGLHLIKFNNPFYVKNGVFIGGVPYFSKAYSSRLKEQLEYISKASSKYSKRILVLHQALDKFLPYNKSYELKISELPRNFHYYALGHIHNRIIEPFGEGKLAYAGSTEIWRIDEYENYKAKGKGFYIVDINDEVKVETVNLKLNREIIKKKIQESELEETLETMIKTFKTYKNKPIVYLNVVGKKYGADHIHNIVTRKLLGNVLNYHINVEYPHEEKGITQFSVDTINIEDVIEEICKKDKLMSKATLELLNLLSKNEVENAKDYVKKIYEGFK